MNEERNITINYSLMADPIETQLKEQGFVHKDIEHIEDLRKGLYFNLFANILTDSQLDISLKRLHKKICREVEILEEMKNE